MITDNEDTKFRIMRGFDHFGIDMMICTKTHRAELTMVPMVPHAMNKETLSITDNSAQMLMDELWRVGVRPSNGEGNVGQIGAMKLHLDDMRKIAFSELSLSEEGK